MFVCIMFILFRRALQMLTVSGITHSAHTAQALISHSKLIASH